LWVPTPADVSSIALGSSPVQFVSLVLNGIVLVVLYDITDFYLILFRYLYHGAHGGGIQACQFGGYCCRTVRRNTCTRSISLYRMSANMESGRRTCFGRTAGHLWLAMAFLGRWSHLHSCCHRLVPAFFRPSVSRKKTEQEEEGNTAKGWPLTLERLDFLWFCFLTYAERHRIHGTSLDLDNTRFLEGKLRLWSESLVGIMSAVNGLVCLLVEMPLVFRRSSGHRRSSGNRSFLYAISYWNIPRCLQSLMMVTLFTIVISLGRYWSCLSAAILYLDVQRRLSGQDICRCTVLLIPLPTPLRHCTAQQVAAAYGYPAPWIMLGSQAILVLLGFWWLPKRISR
jgi:hypothetical protein